MTKAPKKDVPADKLTKPELLALVKRLHKRIERLEALRVSFQPSASELTQLAGAEANDKHGDVVGKPTSGAAVAAFRQAEEYDELVYQEELREAEAYVAPAFPWEKK